jgi:hypothetical protein
MTLLSSDNSINWFCVLLVNFDSLPAYKTINKKYNFAFWSENPGIVRLKRDARI